MSRSEQIPFRDRAFKDFPFRLQELNYLAILMKTTLMVFPWIKPLLQARSSALGELTLLRAGRYMATALGVLGDVRRRRCGCFRGGRGRGSRWRAFDEAFGLRIFALGSGSCGAGKQGGGGSRDHERTDHRFLPSHASRGGAECSLPLPIGQALVDHRAHLRDPPGSPFMCRNSIAAISPERLILAEVFLRRSHLEMTGLCASFHCCSR